MARAFGSYPKCHRFESSYRYQKTRGKRNLLFPLVLMIRPVGQVVKTPPFHGGYTSSNLVRVTSGVGPAANPYPPPSKEGGLLLRRILATAWSLRHLNCFTLTRRSRRGTPYPPPSKEGGLLLRRILATAWSPRYLSCFTYSPPSFEEAFPLCRIPGVLDEQGSPRTNPTFARSNRKPLLPGPTCSATKKGPRPKGPGLFSF